MNGYLCMYIYLHMCSAVLGKPYQSTVISNNNNNNNICIIAIIIVSRLNSQLKHLTFLITTIFQLSYLTIVTLNGEWKTMFNLTQWILSQNSHSLSIHHRRGHSGFSNQPCCRLSVFVRYVARHSFGRPF